MKIIRDKITLRVPYIFHDAEVVEIAEGMYVNGWLYAGDIRTETHGIVEGVTAPDLFIGNALAYDGGWSIVDAEAISKKMDELKASKLQAVQAEKVKIRDGGLILNNIKWDTDERAQAAYIKFFLKVTQNPTLTVTDWKASEGQWTEMNATVLSELSAALEQHETALFTWQRRKEADINACTTIEQLEQVSLKYGE